MSFSKNQYKNRLKKVQSSMQEKGIELLISKDTANINYLRGVLLVMDMHGSIWIKWATHWNALESIEIHCHSIEIDGKSIATYWNSIGIHWSPIEMHWNPLTFCWKRWKVQWNLLEIYWKAFKIHSNPLKSTGIPLKFMVIPFKSIETYSLFNLFKYIDSYCWNLFKSDEHQVRLVFHMMGHRT